MALSRPRHCGRRARGHVANVEGMRTGVAVQVNADVAAAGIMFVGNRGPIRRRPAVAPFGESDNHRLEVAALFGQVVLGESRRPRRRGHEPLLDEMFQARSQNVGGDAESQLEIGEPRHTSEGGVAEDEQTPPLARDLERASG